MELTNQNFLTQKIRDLKESLKLSNVNWSEWEEEFIFSVSSKPTDKLSQKQRDKILDLWEKL